MDMLSIGCIVAAGFLSRLLWYRLGRPNFIVREESDRAYWDFVVGEYGKEPVKPREKSAVWLKVGGEYKK